jgi:hypothetical protein
MSDELSKLTAAPVEVNLGKIKLLMSPLTDRDMAELDEYVRAVYVRNARVSVDDVKDSDPSMWGRVMKFAMETALLLTWSRPPGSNVMGTTDGIVRLAYQGAKKHTSGLTLESLRAALTDPENVAVFRQKFTSTNEVRTSPPTKGDGGSARPTRGRSSTRRSRERTGSRTPRSRT